MAIRGKMISAIAVLTVVMAVAAAPAAARNFEGTVVAKNRDARTFKLKQDEGGGTFRIKVNASTTYDRLSGFGAIRVGGRNIDVVAHKRNGRWIASHVERSGKGGGGSGGGSNG